MTLRDKIKALHEREPQDVCPRCNSHRPASHKAVVCAACGTKLKGE